MVRRVALAIRSALDPYCTDKRRLRHAKFGISDEYGIYLTLMSGSGNDFSQRYGAGVCINPDFHEAPCLRTTNSFNNTMSESERRPGDVPGVALERRNGDADQAVTEIAHAFPFFSDIRQ